MKTNQKSKNQKRYISYAAAKTPMGVAKRVRIQLAKIGIYASKIIRGDSPVLEAYDRRCGRIPGPQFAILAPTWDDEKTRLRWENFKRTHSYATEKEIQERGLPLEFLGSVRVHPSLEVVAEGEGHGYIDRTAQIRALLEEAQQA